MKKVQIRYMDLRETGYKENRLDENFDLGDEGEYNIACLASKGDTQDSNDRPRNRRRKAPRRNISCTSCEAERKDAGHFGSRCRSLEHRRSDTIGNLLVNTDEEKLEDLKETLQAMWESRKTQLKAAERRGA